MNSNQIKKVPLLPTPGLVLPPTTAAALQPPQVVNPVLGSQGTITVPLAAAVQNSQGTITVPLASALQGRRIEITIIESRTDFKENKTAPPYHIYITYPQYIRLTSSNSGISGTPTVRHSTSTNSTNPADRPTTADSIEFRKQCSQQVHPTARPTPTTAAPTEVTRGW